MKPARIVVLVVALAAAGLAAKLVTGGAPPAPVVVETMAPVRNIDILVAAGDLSRGQTLKAADMRWQAWPSDYRPVNSIARSETPDAAKDMAGSLVLAGMMTGDPIRREKVVKSDGSSFMSAILPAGMRAIAMSIDTRGANSAGGFILPNDHVDVIRTFRDDEGSKAGGVDVQSSETVLSNIRVLAIGQNVQEKNGDKVVTGETATLEVTSAQAEQLALAQKVGQLSLALRSLADAGETEATHDDRAETGLTVVRFGVARTIAKR